MRACREGSPADLPAMPEIMILPSLACQAGCKYCFGPHRGPVMDGETARAAVRFVRRIADETGADRIRAVFHGGEPLLAPLEVWKILLEGLCGDPAGRPAFLSLQSNLWNLTDEMLDLLEKYHVRIGTSLDGPEELCDLNRGEGYYARTRASMEKANARGIPVSAIATVTRQTLPRAEEITEYFRSRGIPCVLHAAVDRLEGAENPYSLSPAEYASLITGLYPWYLRHRKEMRIGTLDQFVSAFLTGEAGVCTFRDCLGMFLAVSPTGDITTCQRLAGKDAFRLGNIFDEPTLADLYASPAAQAQQARQERVKAACGGCGFYPVCKGGCYYNAVTGGGDMDPLCEAYKEIFGYVQDRLAAEMASPENREEMLRRPFAPGQHPLLRRGETISLGQEPHPSELADHARRVLAVHALGKYPGVREGAEALAKEDVFPSADAAAALLSGMRERLLENRSRRNNCYLHVTQRCNLRCTHCYAEAGDGEDLPLPEIERIADGAIAAGFRQLVVTGGEPTVHRDWNRIAEAMRTRRGKGTTLVLRTNLAREFTDRELEALAGAFDQVTVSVDGNEETHDARRGTGSYRATAENLRRYAALAGRGTAELSLACVMSAEAINVTPGEDVRAFARELGIKPVKFRPVLPIGRAADWEEPVMCEGILEHESDAERLVYEVRPKATCGIGQNLFIRADGRCYPCYAWCREHTCLGSLRGGTLESVLEGKAFRALLTCSVDTIEKCRDCEFRYLCGGACRAWGNREAQDLNAAPPDCSHLRERAERFVRYAREYLDI